MVYRCPSIDGTLGYISVSSAAKATNGNLLIDCDDSDPNRGVLVTVWKDQDGDRFLLPNSVSEVRCYAGDSRSPIFTGFYPEDEGYSADRYIRRNEHYDCDDTIPGQISNNLYKDEDGDGFGTGNSIGETCDINTAIRNDDCDDSDPLRLFSAKLGSPDQSTCDSYRLGIKESENSNFRRLKIDLDSEDLGKNRNFSIAGLLNGEVLKNEIATVLCIQNCPKWTLSSSGNAAWSAINFDGMKPVVPYENGVFDPKKESQFRVRIRVSVGDPFQGGRRSEEYLLINYSPDCPELYSYKGIRDIFKSGFKTDKIPNTHVAGSMNFDFAPTCPSSLDKKGVSLERLAKAMGFKSFNWWQSIKSDTAKTYEISKETYQWLLEGNSDPDPKLLILKNDYVIDPGLNGSTYVFVTDHAEPQSQVFQNKQSDEFPYYYDQGSEVVLHTSKFSLSYEDAPCSKPGWYTTFQQAPLKLITRVAAVKDGRFILWSAGHFWTSKKMGPPEYCDITAKNLTVPPDYASWPGDNTYEGTIGLDFALVPPLVGKDPESESLKGDLAGTGFTIKIVETQPSSTVPTGFVISQDPQEWEEKETAGEIRVVISSGQYKNCGDVPHGGKIDRVRYKSATVPFGSSCESIKEIQSGTCNDGVLTFDGTAQSDTCSILPQPSTECTKSIKKICKAGIFQSLNCELPDNVVEIKKDTTYLGSLCRESSVNSSFLDFILKLNSYTIKDKKLQVNYGCDARFDVTYKTKCSN